MVINGLLSQLFVLILEGINVVLGLYHLVCHYL